jgi:hypothetical protein
MPLIRIPYDPAIGPVVEIEVSHPIALLQPGAYAPATRAMFIVDTGSTRSHIADHIVAQLALPPGAVAIIRHLGGTKLVDTYPADLTFPTASYSIRSVELREYQQSSIQYGGIIGRDILNLGVLRLDGRLRELMLSF